MGQHRITDYGQVLMYSEIETSFQKAKIWTHYDRLYHIKLTTDKETIVADGIDTATITAQIYNYLDELQDFEVELIVTVEDITETYETTNGAVNIPFASNMEGDFTIMVSRSGYRSGEVAIHVEG